MPHRMENHPLPLTEEETQFIEYLSKSRSGSILRARRAAMLLKYVNGVPIPEIARNYRCSSAAVHRSIDKALRQEVLLAREKDRKKNDQSAVTAEMVAWVRDISCQNPRNLGYSCLEWPPSLLAHHVRNHCRAAGFHALAKLRSTEISRLLHERDEHATAATIVPFITPASTAASASAGNVPSAMAKPVLRHPDY